MPWSPHHRMRHVAVPLACCMNHAMEPSSPHAPRRHAPHGCMHHVITVCSTFSSFFFLLTSSFVFQPPRSNGTMVMMCGHEDTMDDDHRCSTTWCNATHHDHNTTRHDDCDHDSMQHNDPDCDDNTTWLNNSDRDTARGMASVTMTPHSLATVPAPPCVVLQQPQHHTQCANATVTTTPSDIASL